MKEIGERFEEAREAVGISTEEASSDLKVDEEQIQNIEAGNIKAFENVVSLKYLIRDYSKYLGLDAEEMLDEYNEYLFDCTSKISLEDIKAAKRKLAKQTEGVKEKEIKSPYTKFKEKSTVPIWIWVSIGMIILICTCALVFYFVGNETPKEEDIIGYIG